MRAIAEKHIEVAFKREETIWSEIKRLGELEPEPFWSTSSQDEFLEENATYENGMWIHTIMVNGHEQHKRYSLWRDYPSYYGTPDNIRLGMQETLEASECEKELNRFGKYRISLIRDEIKPRTESYWGPKIAQSKYALIENTTDKIIYLEPKAWRFKSLLMNTLATTIDPDTTYNRLHTLNPFRMAIVNSTDSERLLELDNTIDFICDTATQRYSDKLGKNTWVVYIMGLVNNQKRLNNKHNATWFLVNSENKPTRENALQSLKNSFIKYDCGDWTDLMKNYQKQGISMYDIDFDYDYQMLDKVSNKFKINIENVFNVNRISDVLDLIEK